MFQPPSLYHPNAIRDIHMIRGVPVRIFRPGTIADKRNEFIVYCHANATNLTQIGVNMQRLARSTQRVVIAVEYPGYSTNTPDSPSARKSVVSVARVCKAIQDGHPGCKIILVGRSIGTGVATQVLTHVRADLLVLISPFQSIEKMVARKTGQPLAWFIAGGVYDSEKILQHFKKPVLILHGDLDEVIPCIQGFNLSKTCPNCTFELMPNVDHNILPWEKISASISMFINKWL